MYLLPGHPRAFNLPITHPNHNIPRRSFFPHARRTVLPTLHLFASSLPEYLRSRHTLSTSHNIMYPFSCPVRTSKPTAGTSFTTTPDVSLDS